MLPAGIVPLPTSEQDPTPEGVTGQESDSDSRWKQAAIVGEEANGSEETFVHPETLGLRWKRRAMAEPEPEGFEEPEPGWKREAIAEPEPERSAEPQARLERDPEAEGMAEPEPEGSDGPKKRVKRIPCREEIICSRRSRSDPGVCGPQIVCDDLPPARACKTVGSRLVCFDVISKREAIAEPEPEGYAEPEPRLERDAEAEAEGKAEPELEASAEPEPEGSAEPEPEGSDGPKERVKRRVCEEVVICDSPIFGVCARQIICDDGNPDPRLDPRFGK